MARGKGMVMVTRKETAVGREDGVGDVRVLVVVLLIPVVRVVGVDVLVFSS